MQLTAHTLIGGKYRLVKPLASGGMGCIWAARHAKLDVHFAVKFIHPLHAASPAVRARFEREALASAKVGSAHVVQVHDYGVENDTPYLVMELLEGEDLGARLKREKRISLSAAGDILIQVAKGLLRAHEAGIVHRDLKPGNIFLARSDDGEITKILDFGIAKVRSSPVGESTLTGQLIGSPHYMSPEQIQESKSVDGRSDLWSLGVILFRAITGELPFSGDSSGVVMMKVLTDSIPVPSQVSPDLPPALDAFFRRALERSPSKRFQCAREMAEAFMDCAFPVKPPPQSWSFVGAPSQRFDERLPPASAAPARSELTLQSALLRPSENPAAPVDSRRADRASPGGRTPTTMPAVPVALASRAPRAPIGRLLGASGFVGAALGVMLLLLSIDKVAPTRWAHGASLAMTATTSILLSPIAVLDRNAPNAADVAARHEARRADVTPTDTRRAGVSPGSTLAGDPPLAEDQLLTERSATSVVKSYTPGPLPRAASKNRPRLGF
jgi:eukaryotic-like serine/threonine-protein kinase